MIREGAAVAIDLLEPGRAWHVDHARPLVIIWFVPDARARDEVVALRTANARLREVIGAKDTELGMLREQVEALAAQVAELRARLSQNSRNSSRPPSAEGLAKPAPKSLRRKTGRGPGYPKGSRVRRWR
jgi:hypothetical protein